MAIAMPMTERTTRSWIWFPRIALPLMMLVIIFVPTRVHLPYDHLSVPLSSMMAVNNPAYWMHVFLLASLHMLSLGILTVAAWTPWFPRLRSTATKYGPALCILLLYNLFIFKFMTNAVFAMNAQHFPLWPTHAAVALEGNFLEWFFQQMQWRWLAIACSITYGTIWLASKTLLYPLLIYRDGGEVLNDLVKFFFFAPLLALPIYAVIPIYDPWVLNERYSVLPVFKHVDYPAVSAQADQFIRLFAETAAKATSPKLPSFHIVYPLGVALYLRRRGFPGIANYYFALLAVTSFVIIHLGRHFVIDIFASIPFTILVMKVCDRIRINFLLPHDPAAPPVR